MHQTVFLGWGILIALAAIMGLGAYKKVHNPPMMSSFVLALGGALVGGFLVGTSLAGQPSVSSLGALFGGGFTIYLTFYFFRPQMGEDTLDILVSSTFLGLLVTRAGCIGNQCDFGSPTDFIWGVQYQIGPIWQYHRVLGINEGLTSHAVHPFPWMIIIPGAVLFAVVWARDLDRKTEFIVYGYLVIRFFAEFFRDESTSVSVMGVQVGIIVAGILFGFTHRRFRRHLEKEI